MKILLVEDDRSFQEILRQALEKERFVVESASDYHSALLKIYDYAYDCILLDITLPGGSGLDLLRRLKEMKSEGNVIIISARDTVEDKISGLNLGADDYLAKPFHIAELMARIHSVLRRNRPGGEEWITYGNTKVNPHTFEVFVDGAETELSRKEFDILLYFIQRPERLISKSMLAEGVWGDHFDELDNYDFVYSQIKNLRKQLSAAGANIEIISVYGMGYKLVWP